MANALRERRKAILQMVNQCGILDLRQLRAAFPGVSDVTLRKDLQYLDDTKQALRTHGGIKSIPSALNYFYRANENAGLKKEIAAKAAGIISPGDSVFVSAGTTCAELARALPSFPLTVYSDGVYTVSNIATRPNIAVKLLGGDVDLNIMRVEGAATLKQLDNAHFSIAFLGALSLNPDIGFSHNSAMTVAILQKVIDCSDRVVVLLDSTKISTSSYSYGIALSAVNAIVTDSAFPADVAEQLAKKGIEVM